MGFGEGWGLLPKTVSRGSGRTTKLQEISHGTRRKHAAQPGEEQRSGTTLEALKQPPQCSVPGHRSRIALGSAGQCGGQWPGVLARETTQGSSDFHAGAQPGDIRGGLHFPETWGMGSTPGETEDREQLQWSLPLCPLTSGPLVWVCNCFLLPEVLLALALQQEEEISPSGPSEDPNPTTPTPPPGRHAGASDL